MTWKGPRLAGCTRLFEHLDRVLTNNLLIEILPDSYAKVLPRTDFSDHNPILLFVGFRNSLPRPNKPFRFEAMWLGHEKFKEFIDSSWSSQAPLLESLINFKSAIKGWNQDVFGNIGIKKAHILARLKGIQSSVTYPFSRFVCDFILTSNAYLLEK